MEGDVLGVSPRQGIHRTQYVRGVRCEEADEFEQTDSPPMFLPQGILQGSVKDVGRTGDQEEPGFEQDEHLVFGYAVQVVEFHVALPSLENDFDAPAQTVEGKQGAEVGLLWGDGGDQDGPVHQCENRLGRIVTVGLFSGLHAPEIGGFLVDGSVDQTDGRAELVGEEHGDVEVSVFAK